MRRKRTKQMASAESAEPKKQPIQPVEVRNLFSANGVAVVTEVEPGVFRQVAYYPPGESMAKVFYGEPHPAAEGDAEPSHDLAMGEEAQHSQPIMVAGLPQLERNWYNLVSKEVVDAIKAIGRRVYCDLWFPDSEVDISQVEVEDEALRDGRRCYRRIIAAS